MLTHLYNVLEIIISAVFLYGGAATLLSPPIPHSSYILALLGGKVALITYGVIFIILAVTLISSKITKRKNLHKHSLMAMYLVCIFVFWLEFAMLGWSVALVDEVVVGLLSAGLWLRWKLLTEYISPKQFRKMRQELEREG